ncbi:MAG: glutaredoxin family protein [Gammaproteobacteria bacterium]
MNAPADMPAVYFYRRADCELCEELARELGEYRTAPGARAFHLIARDVAADASWAARYGALVPALEIGGIAVCETFFDQARFEEGLRRATDAHDQTRD